MFKDYWIKIKNILNKKKTSFVVRHGVYSINNNKKRKNDHINSVIKNKKKNIYFLQKDGSERKKFYNEKKYLLNNYQNKTKVIPEKTENDKIFFMKEHLVNEILESEKKRNKDTVSGIKDSDDKKKKSKKNKKKWWKIILIITFLLLLIPLLILTYWYFTVEMPSLEKIDDVHLQQSTKIYDRTGEYLLYDFHGDERRTSVTIDKISKHLINATIAIEDKNFKNHNGFILKSFMKAMYQNIKAGKIVRGASTIDQQVIKNYLLTRDKTYIRKFKEIVLALKLDKVKSKDEIMELYLNIIPYGGQFYGIEEASRGYFGKPSADLTVLESAYLAGIPKAPSQYSPHFGDRKKLDERKDLILKLMYEQGYIDDKEYDDAKSSEVSFRSIGESNTMRAPHFTNYVIKELSKKYSSDDIFGGLKVYTTLNWKMYKEMEDMMKAEADWFIKYKASNAASVVTDNRNGEILSMIGSLDFYSKKIDGQTNVTIRRRQPGSTMKPFAYAELIRQGYSPNALVWDVSTQFSTGCSPSAKGGDGCYRPANYSYEQRGPISLRSALVRSLNIPAVKVIYLAGLKEVYTLSNKMGLDLTKDPSYYGLSLVLGSAEVRLLDLTAAYGIFGNDGIKNEITSIKRIVNSNGKEIYNHENSLKTSRVLDVNTSRVVNDMLTSHWPSANIYFPNKTVAVKTGTTNDYKDVLTVGYSKKVSMGMWAGNNKGSPMAHNSSSIIIAPIWKKMMRIVNKYYTPSTFKKPSYSYAVRNKMMLNGKWELEKNVEIDGNPGKYITGHNILHYVDKKDIRKTPKNPKINDPAYKNWEYGVQKWLNNSKKYGLRNIIIDKKEEDENVEIVADENKSEDIESNELKNNNKINKGEDEKKAKKTGKEKKQSNEVKKIIEEKESNNNQNIIKKGELKVSISKLKQISKEDTISININLKNKEISKISYYVNSKRVSGSEKSVVFDLKTFLGLKKKNSIQIKVIDTENKLYEKFYNFTLVDI